MEEDNIRKACLRSYGFRLCREHGVCYRSEGSYRHLVSATAPVEEIERRVQEHCRNKKSSADALPNVIIGKEVGKAMKTLRSRDPPEMKSDSWCVVATKTKLLYCCGCKDVQPMDKGGFQRHMRAEGNKHKCKLSVWGKSELERLVSEVTAIACCGLRCSRATCGRWVIRSRVEPDMAQLSEHLRKLMAQNASQGVQQSESGSTSSSTTHLEIDENLAESSTDMNENALQPDSMMEVETISEEEDNATNTEAQAKSDATTTDNTTITQSTRPVILLLGFTFRKENHEDGRTYEELLDEARCYYGKDNTQLPGAIRDKARIVRLRDAGFDCFCVSKSNKDENEESKHYYGDFCDRKFVQELRERLHKHPVQVCVDWVWCPIGWDTTHYLKPQFFTKTLPDIASVLCSDAIEIEVNNQRITRKRRKDGKVIPSGVIFLPFTLGILTELFKALDVLERQYTISYLDREQLMVEHPMFAATASIPDNEMILLGKGPRPEDEYATDLFKSIDAGASSNIDARQFKSFVVSNCSAETRMIKLTLKDDS